MSEYSIKDKVAVAGLGETKYYKRGQAPVSEFQLACEAILKAVEDAGIKVTDLDGFASYSNDRNDAARLATALGLPHYAWASMVWGGGGGGGSGGAIWLQAPKVGNTGSIFATGGRGGVNYPGFGAGGAGGLGRIRILANQVQNFGTMTPGLPPTLDGTTNGPGYAWVSQVLQ